MTVIESAEAETYALSQARSAPILGPYKWRIDELLAENQKLANAAETIHHLHTVILAS